MGSFLSLAIYFFLPAACVAAVPSSRRNDSFAERFVFGVALYQFLLLGLGLGLGSAGLLKPPVYRVALGCITLLLSVRGARNGIRLPYTRAKRFVRTGRGFAALALCLLAVTSLLLEVAFDFTRGTRHGDGLWYHIPRVMFWLEQGNFKPWVTPVAASLGLPVGADSVLLHKMLLGLGWNGAGFTTAWLALGAAACVYLVGRILTLPRWHATLVALFFMSFPAVGLRVWSINSDIAAAFPVLAAVAALYRIRTPWVGLSLFLLLNAVAVACKPTVAPPAAVLAGIALWQCRCKVFSASKDVRPWAAAALGAAVVLASYWPVYKAFGDFLGGGYTKHHQSASAVEFLYAAGMHTAYWFLEPLGYLSRFRTAWETEALRSVYQMVGAHFPQLPELWKPYPGPDTGYTGLAPLLLFPILVACLAPRWRIPAAAAFVALYLPLCGLIRPQPYFTRYNVVLLAVVALVWGGTRLFRRGRSRWVLVAAVGLNLFALLGIVCINVYLQSTAWSREGGLFHYISDRDREAVASSLAGRPLLVMTESSERLSSLDALLPGPHLAFRIRYVIFPPGGSWAEELGRLSERSNWLAFIHNGSATIVAGPDVSLRGAPACPEVPRPAVEAALAAAGWTHYRVGRFVDLWRHQ